MSASTPRLRAVVVRATGGRVPQAAVWCDGCEAIHLHGALGGHRAAHCTVSDSPYRHSGYSLDLLPEANAGVIRPPARCAGSRRTLRGTLEKASGALRAVLIEHLLGGASAGTRVFIGGHYVEVRRGIAWTIVPVVGAEGHAIPGCPRLRATGHGLSGLGGALFGVSRGVAAARMLRAVAGDQYDAQAMSEIAAAVDAWDARRGRT